MKTAIPFAVGRRRNQYKENNGGPASKLMRKIRLFNRLIGGIVELESPQTQFARRRISLTLCSAVSATDSQIGT